MKKALFATLVTINEKKWRSSWFSTLADALAYAADNPGIEAIEEIGKGVVWTDEVSEGIVWTR